MRYGVRGEEWGAWRGLFEFGFCMVYEIDKTSRSSIEYLLDIWFTRTMTG